MIILKYIFKQFMMLSLKLERVTNVHIIVVYKCCIEQCSSNSWVQ